MTPKLAAHDALNATVIGVAAGLLAWYVLTSASVGNSLVRSFLPWLWLVVGIAAPVGLWFAAVLTRQLPTLYQFAKYGLIGVVNTLLSFAILNFLAHLTGVTQGLGAGVFVVMAFVIANTHSFLWNKNWTFNATAARAAPVQYLQFSAVTLTSSLLAALLVSAITHFASPPTGLTATQWLNVANLAGTILALAGNFLGFKIFVFNAKR
ncbi:GtrA family protein [Candidatus Parcubacteria bacterium]|nr:GtrA family protein [Candidatus Parcubacteria bacterium]